MRFRVCLIQRASAPLTYGVLIPIAFVTADSAAFITGFCDGIFRLPRGTILAYEPLLALPQSFKADFQPFGAGLALLGDIAVDDARRLFLRRYLDNQLAAIDHEFEGGA